MSNFVKEAIDSSVDLDESIVVDELEEAKKAWAATVNRLEETDKEVQEDDKETEDVEDTEGGQEPSDNPDVLQTKLNNIDKQFSDDVDEIDTEGSQEEEDNLESSMMGEAQFAQRGDDFALNRRTSTVSNNMQEQSTDEESKSTEEDDDRRYLWDFSSLEASQTGIPLDLEEMAQAMGFMISDFMANVTGSNADDVTADFGLMMGQAMNMLMVMTTGKTEYATTDLAVTMTEVMSQMSADDKADMMLLMSQFMMNSMPDMTDSSFSEMSAMMDMMMESFTLEMTDSSLSEMSNTMGSMMLAFMGAVNGSTGDDVPQEFALSMGTMMNQFMVGFIGSSENSAQIMSDMVGAMMSAMINPTIEDGESSTDLFSSMISAMMGVGVEAGELPTEVLSSTMNEMMGSMMNDMPISAFSEMMDQMKDKFTDEFTASDDPFGSIANSMGSVMYEFMDGMTGNDSETPAQEFALTMGEMINQFTVGMTGSDENSMQLMSDIMGSMMGSMMSEITGDSASPLESFTVSMNDMMGSYMTNMSENMLTMMDPMTFPSTLYIEDVETGSLSHILESDMTNEDGSSVDISQMLGSDTFLVGYTVPNAQTMNLGSLLSLTTMVEGGTFALEDLPMIPTDDGSMISINEMSTMMNTMMGMFMGSQMTSTDGSMMDMESMEAMMAPYMEMMSSFMGGMNMEAMMPMMSGMMETMIDTMNNSDMMDSMAEMSASMMDMMSTSMSDMPVDAFGSMSGVLMDTFTQEILLDGNPMDNMANTMGSMMYEFMNGMTGNDSEVPTQEFALTMGEMINQFMVGVTGGNEDPAAAMGDMMGTMMNSMMAGMTGDSEAPLDSFTTTIGDMMDTFMTDMATSAVAVMTPMDSMLNTFVNGIDSNMAFIESMFNSTNDSALSLIEQSPEYMTTILSLSDDIGLMADRINDMGDTIVDTQVTQSENFLATQDSMSALVDSLISQKSLLTDGEDALMSIADFDAMMANLTSGQTALDSLVSAPEVSMDDIFATQLYIQDKNGLLTKVSEADLALEDGSTDISTLLLGGSLLVGYTIPNSENMSLSELLAVTTMIENSGMDMSQMPMFSLTSGDSSIIDMSGMMETMMGMFMGSGMISTDDMSPQMMTAFSDMMNSFMAGSDMDSMMDMDSFNLMMGGMMDSMMSSGMTDSVMDMSDSMMDMLGNSMGSMPMDSFSYMMSGMMDSFGEVFAEGDSPMDAMAKTMGSMMLEFMAGMTGNDSEAPAQEFARTMGEMMNQFMVGVTGTDENSAAAMGDMMGTMMGSFMISITGDAENPMESFSTSMSNMMGSMMGDMSESAAIVMDPMADMMNTFLIGVDGNMEFIASMFDTANGTAQSMIELSPEYMETILRLSDDIGLMADRIDEMADKIVDTVDLQSTNFEATQANALELIEMLNVNSEEYIALLGEDDFSQMMSDLMKIDTSLTGISDRVSTETATIFPSDLFIQDLESGNLIKMSEEDMMSDDGSYVDITQLLDTNTMMVAYTIPMNDSMTLSDLMSMTTMVEGTGFSMDMLPMFGENNSIIDINSFMDMALNPETLSMMSMPVDQFDETIATYQEQIVQSDSPFDAMGQTMGTMMMSFMEGMTDSEGEESPLVFAETMGEMTREFMIGITGGNEEPATAMGEMMGSMMGSFMSSMTLNDETPMTQFTDTMSSMMSTFSTDMTSSMLTMIDPTTDLLNTVVNGINGNMDFIAAMFDSANGTVEDLIEQTPTYLDTMLRLSDDIGLMADRINDMGDKIVETQVILSDTFLITQANSLELTNTINANSAYLIGLMGQTEFDAMMANFTALDGAMDGAIANMTIPENTQMSSALYAMDENGNISLISEADLTAAMESDSADISSFLNGSEVLVGYTIPSSDSMTLSEIVAETTIIDENVTMQELPMFTLDGMDASTLDLSEMMSSMMSMMMGQNVGIPTDELVSAPFLSMMESFANGMGLELESFMTMMNQMMDTMMMSEMIDSMAEMANQMTESMSFSMGGTQVDTFNDMMSVMMNTFMSDGSPMATVADMMGSMMMSMMGEMTPGENDTIDSMAYQMGAMMQAYFAGVTGVSSEDGSPAMAMGDIMTGMMTSFMSSITGDGESFSEIMNGMMDRFMSDMSESMLAVSEPLMDSVNILLNGMDANMDLLNSMMADANKTLDAAIDLTPEYLAAMTSLSDDIVEMAGRVDEMVDKMDTTAQLQMENLTATQDNIFILMDTLGENPAFDTIVNNLSEAKNLIMPEASLNLSDVVFSQVVTDIDSNQLFSISSFDSLGASTDVYEHDLEFSGADSLLIDFNDSISSLSFDIELTNYISVHAFDSSNNKIELDSSNFSVDSTTASTTISINNVTDLKYISVDSNANSAFTLSVNSIDETLLTDILAQETPQELAYTISLDQASQEDTTLPMTINGELSEVTIPAGETSLDLSMKIDQDIDALDIALDAPAEDAVYSLNSENSEISSTLSDLTAEPSAFEMPDASTLDSVELFSLVEQDIGILDLTNSLSENIVIDTTELFSDTQDESLNSMLIVTGDSDDSITIDVNEWDKTATDSMDGFHEYASVKDLTVTLRIEDDLTVV